MQHWDLRIGSARYLICEPQATSDGRPTGYGNLIRHVEQTIRAAAALGATVFFIRPQRPVNPALFDLSSPDVRIVGQNEWRALLLRILWRLCAPMRHRQPLAWMKATAGRRARPLVERAKHWTRSRGWRAIDRSLDRFGHRCRIAAHGYERHIVRAWSSVYSEARQRARAGSKKHRVRVRLRPAAEARAQQIARDIGLDVARPLVTLHVREGGYRTRGADRQRYFDAIREARLEAYAPAVEWLTTRGYQVVRIGDPTMTPCRWPGVIDVATAPWRTGAFEIWALLQSRFFIASDSGPYFLSKLCGVPCLSLNVVQLGYYVVSAQDRYVCKHVYDSEAGRRLSLAEMLSEPFVETALERQRYQWIENSPAELMEAVEDMIALLDNPAARRTPAQQRHDRLLADMSPARSRARSRSGLLFRKPSAGTISPRFAARYLDTELSHRLEPDPRLR